MDSGSLVSLGDVFSIKDLSVKNNDQADKVIVDEEKNHDKEDDKKENQDHKNGFDPALLTTKLPLTMAELTGIRLSGIMYALAPLVASAVTEKKASAKRKKGARTPSETGKDEDIPVAALSAKHINLSKPKSPI